MLQSGPPFAFGVHRMLFHRCMLMLVAALSLSVPVQAEPMKSAAVVQAYPESRRLPLVEDRFGEAIADPYRWLENDVRQDREVADWVQRQNEVTQGYLAALPQRAWFAQRIRSLLDFERYGLPVKKGRRYFYSRNSGLQNQSQLYVREGLEGAQRLLLDPNSWADDGTTALDDWQPSPDGRYLAYSVQDGGSDWRTVKLLDVVTGKAMADELHWVKFSLLAWVGNEGFFYSRFPKPEDGQAYQARNYNHAIWFHRIGTPQDEDQLVYATPDKPEVTHNIEVTSDGRYGVITSYIGTDSRFEMRVIDLRQRRRSGSWQARTLVSGFNHAWRLVDGLGTRLWFVTNQDAPRFRLVSVDLRGEKLDWRELVAEQEEVLSEGAIIGNKLILNYMHDASSRALVYDLSGKPARTITLSGIGTASGFKGRPGDPETFYTFTSFNRPPTVYRHDIATGVSSPFAEPRLTFRPEDYDVDQKFYRSKDGTRVPMFIVRKRGLVGKAAPTLLYGYGGFDISLTPGFSATRMAWLEAGGAFALANLRGGGEYGKAWHEAGRGANKQNVFDDFIAAGEYLIAEGITPRGGLSIQGGSNGGLLVGAVINQRPDLFAAANPAVGVMDMLRFDQFTAGRYWVDDYGYPDREPDFRVLRAYSPYHNIRGGTPYPAVLVTTADTDDRVVPGHSFKYAAALQAAGLGPRPQLIRVETRAGHGAGKPTDKVVEEYADIYAFLAQWSGLEVK